MMGYKAFFRFMFYFGLLAGEGMEMGWHVAFMLLHFDVLCLSNFFWMPMGF